MFFAPEMFQVDGEQESQTNDELTDIWALGTTLFYMLTGQYPFEKASSLLEMVQLVVKCDINFDLIKHEEARALVKGMLNPNREDRFTLERIIESPWVSNNGAMPLDLSRTESFRYGKEGFGNISRHIKTRFERSKSSPVTSRSSVLVDSLYK